MNEEALVFSAAEIAYMRATGQPIGRFNKRQTALALGCKPHNIRLLVKKGLLMPLGSLSLYCEQYFCAVEVMAKAKDKGVLARCTRAIQEDSEKHNHPERD